MPTPKPQLLSAQVVLKPSAGNHVGTAITSSNLRDFAPSEEQTSRAKEAFTKLGFTLGEMVGNSFSITAKPAVFKKALGTSSSGPGEIPVTSLPEPLRKLVHAVVFPSPPEFGPSSY